MTDSPGLVALYDIRPGNGSGPFLQPRSLHGAVHMLYSKHNLSHLSEITIITNLIQQLQGYQVLQVALPGKLTQQTDTAYVCTAPANRLRCHQPKHN